MAGFDVPVVRGGVFRSGRPAVSCATDRMLRMRAEAGAVDTRGNAIEGNPIDKCRQMLLNGATVAIKGLGGFHLAARADNETAVNHLRARKKRDHKPFAMMVGSIAEMRRIVVLSNSAASIAQSPACPIILAPARPAAGIASSVALASHRLGVMLPYTPIQHLLFDSTTAPTSKRNGQKNGDAASFGLDCLLPPLVMTSGNLSDEPLAIDNAEGFVDSGRCATRCSGTIVRFSAAWTIRSSLMRVRTRSFRSRWGGVSPRLRSDAANRCPYAGPVRRRGTEECDRGGSRRCSDAKPSSRRSHAHPGVSILSGRDRGFPGPL